MYIAQKLRESNPAEYILYMWQVEDLLRAAECDMERLKGQYLSRFSLSGQQAKEMEDWYAHLCDMMRHEGITEKGHLRITKNMMQQLSELHHRALSSGKFPDYGAHYYQALPSLREVEGKGMELEEGDVEAALNLLYGVMMLRLQKKDISEGTASAATQASLWLRDLARLLLQDKKEPLDI